MIKSKILSEICKATDNEMPLDVKRASGLLKRIVKNKKGTSDQWNSLSQDAQEYLREVIEAIGKNQLVPMPKDFEETLSPTVVKKKEEEEEGQFFSGLNYFECRTTNKQISIRGIIEMKESGQLRIPTWQRNFIWTNVQQKQFLRGVLLGIPIFSIMVAVDEDTNERFLLDGVQRTSTFHKFFNDEVMVDRKKFSQLPDRLRNQFLQQDITLTEVRCEKRYWPDIYHFINKGGSPLLDIEIWRAIYEHDLMTKLEEIAVNHTLWSEIYGKAKDRRYKGMALLLRAVAMHLTYRQYQKPMKSFILNFMDNLCKNPDSVDAVQLYSNIDRILFGVRNLGRTLFRTSLGGQSNAGMIDCIFHAGFEAIKERPGCTAPQLERWMRRVSEGLLKDQRCLDALTLDTSGNDSVALRMSYAETLIYEILDEENGGKK